MAPTESKREGGARSLAQLLPRLTRAAMGRRGFAEAGLLSDWAAIAGAEIAAHCLPERLEFARGARLEGTLHLRVEGAWAPALQHLEPQLVERINGSLGYRAVARLRLLHGPLPERRGTPEAGAGPADPARVAPEARARLAAQAEGIEDAGLRRAVERLGLALLAAESSPAPRRPGGR